MILMIKSMLNP